MNSKKVAAVAGLGVALFYLRLAGANVATERAFIMIAVVLGAVLLGRRALSLRSVAVAGIVLTVLPLAVAGILQGLKLADATVPFTATVNATLMALRISTLGELLVLFANFIFVRNVWGVLGSLGRARLADFWAAGTAPVKVEEVPG